MLNTFGIINLVWNKPIVYADFHRKYNSTMDNELIALIVKRPKLFIIKFCSTCYMNKMIYTKCLLFMSCLVLNMYKLQSIQFCTFYVKNCNVI